jgi:hypothetical protein
MKPSAVKVYEFCKANPNIPDMDLALMLQKEFDIPSLRDCQDIVKATREALND